MLIKRLVLIFIFLFSQMGFASKNNKLSYIRITPEISDYLKTVPIGNLATFSYNGLLIQCRIVDHVVSENGEVLFKYVDLKTIGETLVFEEGLTVHNIPANDLDDNDKLDGKNSFDAGAGKAIVGALGKGLGYMAVSPKDEREVEALRRQLEIEKSKYSDAVANYNKTMQREITELSKVTKQLIDEMGAEKSSNGISTLSKIAASTSYKFKTSDVDFIKRAKPVYNKLYDHIAKDEVEATVKNIGLAAITSADELSNAGDKKEAEIGLGIASEMADLLVGIDPVTGFVRDGVEFFSGLNMITGEKLSIFDRTLAGVGLVTSTLSFGVGSTIKNSVKASYKILTKIPYSKLAKNLFLKPTKKLFANMGSITDRLYSLHQKGVKPSASTSKHLAKRILNEKEILNGGKYTDVELETIEVLHKQLEKSLPNVKGVSVNEEVWRAVPEKYTNSKGISILNTDKSVFDLHPGTLSGNHRYSMPGERGLYTSMGPEVTAWKTVMEELGPLADKPLRLAPARAILNNVLDLTDGKVLKVLSIKNSQLVRQDYLMTHTIGSVARSKGFKGIKYPSQHTKDTNLVIFYGE